MSTHRADVTVLSARMPSSVGDLHSMRDHLTGNTVEAIRYAPLSAHYSQPPDWTPKTPRGASDVTQSEALFAKRAQAYADRNMAGTDKRRVEFLAFGVKIKEAGSKIQSRVRA